MKKIISLPLFMLSLLVVSCSSDSSFEDEQGEEIKDEIVSLKLKVGGEFNVLESQSKAVENTDPFGIQIYEESESGNKPYAFLYGDDLSDITIDFKRGKNYNFEMTYIKNAKKLLYTNAWTPFGVTNDFSPTLNTPIYSSDEYMDYWIALV